MGLVLFLIAASAFATQEAKEFDLWTLNEIVAAAKASDVAYQKAVIAKKKADLRITKEQANFGPTLSLGAASFSGSAPSQQSAGLYSEWEIFSGGRRLDQWRLAQLHSQQAHLQWQHALQDLIARALEKALSVEVAQALFASLQQRTEILQQQYRIVNALYRQGLATATDYQRLSSELARARLQKQRQELEQTLAYESLYRELGLKDIRFKLDFSLQKTLAELEALSVPSTQLIRSAPQPQIAALQVEQQQVQTRSAQRPLWPEVSLQASAGQEWPLNHQDLDAGFSWQVQARLQWTLWDWGRRSSQLQIARLNHYEATLEKNQIVLEGKSLLKTLDLQIDLGKKALAVAQKIKSLEQRTFRQTQEDYRNGQASYLDLISTLDRQIQAQNDEFLEMQSLILMKAKRLSYGGKLNAMVSRDHSDSSDELSRENI